MNQLFLLGALHPSSLFLGGVPRWTTSVWPLAGGPGVGQHCRNRRSQRISATRDASGWFHLSWKKRYPQDSWTSIDLSHNLVLWKWPLVASKLFLLLQIRVVSDFLTFSCRDWSYDEMPSCLCIASGTIWSGTKQVRCLRGVWILWPWLRWLKIGKSAQPMENQLSQSVSMENFEYMTTEFFASTFCEVFLGLKLFIRLNP